MKRLAVAVALLAAALSGGVGRSHAAFTATSSHASQSFGAAAQFNAVVVSMGPVATPLRGTVTLTATATSDRPIVSVRYQYAPTGTSNWSDACTATVTPHSCDWNTTAVSDASYDLRAIATDTTTSSRTSATITNRRVDNTAPAVTLTDPGTPLTGPRTLAATTGASDVSAIAIEYRTSPSGDWTQICSDTSAPYNCAWNTASRPDGLYDLRARATDQAGNVGTSNVVANRRVDNNAPAVSLPAYGPSRGTVTAQATLDDGAGSGIASVRYEYRPQGTGPWTVACTSTAAPFSCPIDTTVVTDGLYQVQAIASDNVGLPATSAPITVRVDNTAPTTATMADPGSPLSGSRPLTGTAGDAAGGSGIASLRFQYAPANTTNWTDACVDTSAPFTTCSWNTTAVPDGVYDLRALAVDGAGGTLASPTFADRRLENHAPTVNLNDPGTPLSGTETLAATAADGIGPVVSFVLEYKPSSASTWTSIGCWDTSSPYSCPWNTTPVADGTYDLRARVTDSAGKTATSVVAARVVDNGPRATAVGSSSGGANGALSSGDTLTFTYSEPPARASLAAGWTGGSRVVTVTFTDFYGMTTVEVRAAGTVVPIGLVWLDKRLTSTASATFNGTMTLSGAVLTVALSGTPTQGAVAAAALPVGISWWSSGDVTDEAGNAGVATALSGSGQL